MSATHQIDSENKLIVTTWQGEAKDLDFIEALMKYQEEIQCHPDYIDYNELVDLSDVTNIKLTGTGLKNLGKIAAITDRDKSVRKLAIVTPSNKGFFLARMYKGYRSFSVNSNKHIEIFGNVDDARDWLQEP